MKRIALVALIALTGLCSILAAPTKEWRMPEQTVVPDGVAFPAAEEEQTGLVEAASAPAVAKNPVESKNQVVTNQPDRESAEARPSAQADEGWKWNGWKIASVVFLVLGIMGVKSSIYLERIVVVTLIVASGVLYYIGSSPDSAACALKVLQIVAIGYGGLFFLACFVSIVQNLEWKICLQGEDRGESYATGWKRNSLLGCRAERRDSA